MNQSDQKNLKQAECDSMKRRTGAQAESNREFTVVRRGSRGGSSREGASCWHWKFGVTAERICLFLKYYTHLFVNIRFKRIQNIMELVHFTHMSV